MTMNIKLKSKQIECLFGFHKWGAWNYTSVLTQLRVCSICHVREFVKREPYRPHVIPPSVI